MIYLDTSIIVSAYCLEPLSDRVDELLRRESDIAISDLTEVDGNRSRLSDQGCDR